MPTKAEVESLCAELMTGLMPISVRARVCRLLRELVVENERTVTKLLSVQLERDKLYSEYIQKYDAAEARAIAAEERIKKLEEEAISNLRTLMAAVHAAGGTIRVGLTTAVIIPQLILERHDDPRDGSMVFTVAQKEGS